MIGIAVMLIILLCGIGLLIKKVDLLQSQVADLQTKVNGLNQGIAWLAQSRDGPTEIKRPKMG